MRFQLIVLLLSVIVNSVCFGQLDSIVEDSNITTYGSAIDDDLLVLEYLNGSYLKIPLTTTTPPEITTLHMISNDETTITTENPITIITTDTIKPIDIDATETITSTTVPQTTILTIATSTATTTTRAMPVKLAPTTYAQTTTASTTKSPTITIPTTPISITSTQIKMTTIDTTESATRKVKLLKHCMKPKPTPKICTKKSKHGGKRKHRCKKPEIIDDSFPVMNFWLVPKTKNFDLINPSTFLEERYKGGDDPYRFEVFRCWVYQSCGW